MLNKTGIISKSIFDFTYDGVKLVLKCLSTNMYFPQLQKQQIWSSRAVSSTDVFVEDLQLEADRTESMKEKSNLRSILQNFLDVAGIVYNLCFGFMSYFLSSFSDCLTTL